MFWLLLRQAWSLPTACQPWQKPCWPRYNLKALSCRPTPSTYLNRPVSQCLHISSWYLMLLDTNLLVVIHTEYLHVGYLWNKKHTLHLPSWELVVIELLTTSLVISWGEWETPPSTVAQLSHLSLCVILPFVCRLFTLVDELVCLRQCWQNWVSNNTLPEHIHSIILSHARITSKTHTNKWRLVSVPH